MANEQVMNSNTQPTTPTNNSGIDTNLLMKGLQESLISNSGIITSGTSEVENRFNSAIESIKTGREAGNSKLQSEFERNANYTLDKFNSDQLAGREQQSGGMQAFGALKVLTDSTDKSLKDMAMRKEELVLANNVAAANKITDLEIQAVEYREKARQQVFNNILSLGNFAETVKSGQREEKAQSFREKQTMAEIGLKYGVSINPGDTIETVVTRAMPTASAQAKAELAKTLAETRKINADIATISKGNTVKGVDNTTLDVMAETLNRLELSGDKEGINSILKGIESSGGFQAISYVKNKTLDLKQAGIDAERKSLEETTKKSKSISKGSGFGVGTPFKTQDVTRFFQPTGANLFNKKK